MYPTSLVPRPLPNFISQLQDKIYPLSHTPLYSSPAPPITPLTHTPPLLTHAPPLSHIPPLLTHAPPLSHTSLHPSPLSSSTVATVPQTAVAPPHPPHPHPPLPHSSPRMATNERVERWKSVCEEDLVTACVTAWTRDQGARESVECTESS